MCELMLVRPSKLYAEQVMSYKEEMLQCGDSFAGCAGLEDVQSFDEWIDFVVGMIDFRHPLSDFLKNFGVILDIVFVRQKDEKVMRLKCWDWFYPFVVSLEKVRFY